MRSGTRRLIDGALCAALVGGAAAAPTLVGSASASAASLQASLLMLAAGYAGARFGLIGGMIVGVVLAAARWTGTVGVVTDAGDDPRVLSGWIMAAVTGVPLIGIGAVLGWLSDRARAERRRHAQQATEYRRRLYLKDRRAGVEADEHRSRATEHERELNRYSSLVVSLREAAQRINMQLNLSDLCHSFLRSMEQILRVESATICLLDETGTRLMPTARMGPGKAGHLAADRDATTGIYEYCLRNRVAYVRGTVTDFEQAGLVADGAMTAEAVFPLCASAAEKDGGAATPLGLVEIARMTEGETLDVRLASMLCSFLNVAVTNANLFRRIEHMAQHDGLTGLYNRRFFFEESARLFAESERRGEPFSVVMCDVDHFKQFNDRYGHAAGDTALTAAAHRWRASLRDLDIAGRYGGEEFVFALPATSLDGGRQAAERMRQAIADEGIQVGSSRATITASFGVAASNGDCRDIDRLIRLADEALYQAKANGRNRVIVYPEGDQAPERGAEPAAPSAPEAIDDGRTRSVGAAGRATLEPRS